MPNYLEIIGTCYEESEAYVTESGDPSVYADLQWLTPAISQAILDTGCPEINPLPTTISATAASYSDVYEFGNHGDVYNKFLNNAANDHKSLDSCPLALSNGEVVHVSISTEKNALSDFTLQIIVNAVKGTSGQYAGGIQIGTDIEKPSGQLDILVEFLTGFTFNKGDRIAAYIAKGSTNGGKAEEPVIRIFVRYD